MDSYKQIEELMAKKYGKGTTTKKATGDFMLSDNHAVSVKSNNIDKQNYSPNMISIKKMHQWVFEERKQLSFIFVDYKEIADKPKILKETPPIPIEQISWDCLTIEAQGYGVIQMSGPRKIIKNQTKRDFYRGFLEAYDKYREKERKKHDRFEHWRQIRTNNLLERVMREIRRRTRVVGAFPDGQSALMLVAARLRHVSSSKWGTNRYMDMRRLFEAEGNLNMKTAS